ncbi:Ankyrin repeat-containing domain protein [Colletotrichum scovillei]|uniref:Ankyrin repeat-containing domain protein n=2 Tax=Colletotrichum scovillei TaxID=1209932 RepID=A0A9P7U9M2_9PEZI|nr:Ankyrin repeat-containing domain protein [Colletotrichum scovillei]KAG7043194.1 Ankyrin repeat-containing domain protein [Colletotrichum scovillei]
MELLERFDAEDGDPDKDILVVHGLSHSGGSPWEASPTKPAWLRQDLFNDSNSNIIAFNYENFFDSQNPLCTRAGLEFVACQLLDDIMAWKASEGDRPLAILAHDTGGVLVKMAIIIASGNLSKYSQLLSSVYVLIFLGCPHKTSSAESLVNGFATLIYNTHSIPSVGLFQAAKLCAEMTTDVNHLFLNSNLPFMMHIISVFSEALNPIDRTFDEFTATLDLSCETRLGLPHPHGTLLGHELDEKANKLLKEKFQISITETLSSQRVQVLLSSVSPPPTFQLGLEYVTSDKLGFKEDLDEWIENHSSSKTRYIWAPTELSPSGAIGSFVRLVSEANQLSAPKTQIRAFVYQFREIRAHPQIQTKFRLSSMRLVLESFLAQGLTYISPRMEPDTGVASLFSLFESALSPAGALSEDLLTVLFVTLNNCLRRNGIRPIWSVWNLEHCGGDTEVTRLLSNFKELFQFTTHKPAILVSWSGQSAPNFEGIMQDAGIHPFRLRFRYRWSQDHRIQISSEFLAPHGGHTCVGTLPELIKAALCDTKDDELRQSFMQLAIRTAQTSASGVQCLRRVHEAIDDNGKLDPHGLQAATSGFLARDETVFTNSALLWVQFCCRYLSPTELVTALALEGVVDKSNETESISGQCHLGKEIEDNSSAGFHFIQNHLSGLIQVVDGECRLTSDIIGEPNDTGPWYSHNAKSNLWILRCLLRHLGDKAEREGLDIQSPHSEFVRPSPFHHDLTTYAANFWSHHYRIAQSHTSTKLEAEAMVARYLKANHVATLLMLRYVQHTVVESPRRAISEDTTATAVALLVCHGFDDVEEIGTLASCPGWESSPKTVFPALLEAVRGVHTTLLPKLSVSVLGDEEAGKIFSAVEPGNLTNNCIHDLFRQAQSRPNFHLPFELVFCAAFAGIEVSAKSIKGCKLDSSMWLTWLLRCIATRKSDATKMISRLAEPHLSEGQKDDILLAASLVCDSKDVLALMSWLRLDISSRSLRALVYSGNHTALKKLLASQSQNEYFSSAGFKESLHMAVDHSSLEIVRELLDHVDVVQDKEVLMDCLSRVIQKSASKEVCLLLLDTGVEIDYGRQEQYLSDAVKQDNPELAQVFLDCGVSIDAQESSGEPPLYVAAKEGTLSMVEFLVKRGADVNVRTDAKGLTPLYGATLQSRPEVVEYLLSKGADVTIPSKARNWSPLEGAYDYPAVMAHLVTKAWPPPDYHRVAEFGDTQCTALFLAATYGKTDSVRLLLKHGDPDIEFTPSSDIEKEKTDTRGYTALAVASLYSHTDIVRLLLEHGANVNHRIPGTRLTPLHLAHSGDTLAVLLEYGADKEAKDDNGYTPLFYAVTKPDSSLTRRLVNAGANFKATDNWGHAALLNALIYGEPSSREENCRYLISKGAPINEKGPDRYGSTVHRCCRFGEVEEVELILELGGDAGLWYGMQGTLLEAACNNVNKNDLRLVRYLVEKKGVDINGPGSYLRSAMGEAFRSGDESLIRYLLENGGRFDTLDGNGQPAWFNICARKDDALEMFDMLLDDYGAEDFLASLGDKDRTSRNILHCTALSGHLGLVERLVDLDPNLVDSRDIDGWSALHWAARMASIEGLGGEDIPQKWEEKAEIIKFLARKGCPGLTECVPGGNEGTWDALEIAEYHGAPEVIVAAFRDMMEDAQVQVESTKALSQRAGRWICDGCNTLIWGAFLICDDDDCYKNFGLCFKCAPHKDELHDPKHVFVIDERGVPECSSLEWAP